jgi:hypothetical protein
MGFVFSVPGFLSLRMAERFSKNCKALEIETDTKMEIWLRWLLFSCHFSLVDVTYLNKQFRAKSSQYSVRFARSK